MISASLRGTDLGMVPIGIVVQEHWLVADVDINLVCGAKRSRRHSFDNWRVAFITTGDFNRLR